MAIQCEPTESFAIDAGRWSEEVRKRSSEKFVHFHWKSVHKQDVKWIVQCLWLHFSNASSIIGSGSLRMICGSSDANSHVIDDRPFINEVFAQAPQCQLREIVCVCVGCWGAFCGAHALSLAQYWEWAHRYWPHIENTHDVKNFWNWFRIHTEWKVFYINHWCNTNEMQTFERSPPDQQ